MAATTTSLTSCPTCGSNDRNLVRTDKVPGGIDWRYFACEDCGNEWRA